MTLSILITQCLQNDFVKPLGKYDPQPNQLHVGFQEARRLMGDEPANGPVAMMMKWAYRQPQDTLSIIHIRDWHHPDDAFEAEHFRQFGEHCIRDTEGAEFAFPVTDENRAVTVINSPGLNDFVGTHLNDYLIRFSGKKIKVGIMGVWTEAKVLFLAYDIRSRFPQMEIAVCSALTASSSRMHHFFSLDQLRRILGVKVFSSVGDFINYLGGSAEDVNIPLPVHADQPKIHPEGIEKMTDTDTRLVRHLFKDCSQVHLKMLTGGFSGNLVLAANSTDVYGHEQVPHVVKIGPQAPIGKERESFEQIEDVLGNHAPRITDFVDDGTRGALKYRYAAMGKGFSTTFKKIYCSAPPASKVKKILETVFQDQLGQLYKAARLERTNLLKYYQFSPGHGTHVQERINALYGKTTQEKTLILPTGKPFPNPALFYQADLPDLFDKAVEPSYFSFVHGDLNGANIVIDSQENVWLIDFFHTQQGHVLKDLIKLENDLLYIFTPLNNKNHLEEAVKLTDLLLDVKDLAQPLPGVEKTGLSLKQVKRAYETVKLLRSFYPPLVKKDRSPIQVLIGQLRYAAHTLSFDESNRWQKFWALYTAGRISALLKERLQARGPLRIDWLDTKHSHPGRIGMTILPGRRDYNRSLREDLVSLKKEGVTHVVTLVTPDELVEYGVENLAEELENSGFETRYLGIKDQGVSSLEQMSALVRWIKETAAKGKKVLLHCVGGLGRSGLAAASYLVAQGMDVKTALAEVRRVRSPRAIESREQENFLLEFESYTRNITVSSV